MLGFYELLMRDSEPEVRSEAVAKVPMVAPYCQPASVLEKILPIMKEQMSADASQHVKGALATAICEMASSLPRQDTVEQIFPAVVKILTKESVTEVRVSLLENLAKLAKAVGEEATVEHIVPEIEKLCGDLTWRVRLATINYIPQLLDFITPAKFDEKALPLIQAF